MLDFDLIDSTIVELENGDTNFTNCERLASLYIIKEHFTKPIIDTPIQMSESAVIGSSVQKELFDILPHYNIYCDKKRDYQMNQVGEDIVLQSLKLVCQEIMEFIQTLYSSTDMEQERDIIRNMLSNLSSKFEKPLI